VNQDEAAAFLRAIDSKIIEVDHSGYVRCVGTRQKAPETKYCLFTRNREGVSLNTEYLIQFGAAAELVTNFGWSADDVTVEAGEFDAVVMKGFRTLVAMEAKARVDDPNGLARLLESFIRYSGLTQPPDANNNHSRKYFDLFRRCAEGPVILLLVADGARWAFQTERVGSTLRFGEVPLSALIPAGERSPNLDDAIALAAATEVDGEQRAYPYEWTSAEQVSDFLTLLKGKIEESRLSYTRPWRWTAATSGGDALTNAGKRCGLELRFSRYQ
jgi:hypothetical protein